MSAALVACGNPKTTPADSPERVSGKAFQATPKAKRPAEKRAVRIDIEPISWPVRQEPVRALEPAREPEQVLQGQALPERVQPERVRLASSVLQEPAQAPVCWPLAPRRVPDAHRRFFRKHNTRQPPE
ncbi:hypothetical protein ACFSOZ_05640 [Mesorhizobium newzealandense]|uniref:Uncharacterized protein n=1 Tax=Mesorhizobium newzealandense TaxID=1300302 RepID=A0ABW4U532_9HYPH